MKHQPLLFLGDRRRDAVLQKLASSARRWRQSWVAQSAAEFEANCESPQAAGFTLPVASVATSAWQLELAGDRIAVLLLPHVTFAWVLHEDGVAPPDSAAAVAPESLAERLEHEVARSLLLESCGVDAHEVTAVTRMPTDEIAAWSRAARAWKMQLRTSTGRSLTLLLTSSRIEKLAPARAVADIQPLAPRREAVGENTVTLRALVGETHIPVRELAELALDDVLVLDQALGDPVAVVCGHAAVPVIAGNLGRAGARRAIKIINKGLV
jgi:flagellar motor switch/type III secretory pathway protein FliN